MSDNLTAEQVVPSKDYQDGWYDGMTDAVSAMDETVKLYDRFAQIVAIIDAVENRCMAHDGPVGNTRQEMTDDELREIYKLAGGVIHE
jgi:hypothetical protein